MQLYKMFLSYSVKEDSSICSFEISFEKFKYHWRKFSIKTYTGKRTINNLLYSKKLEYILRTQQENVLLKKNHKLKLATCFRKKEMEKITPFCSMLQIHQAFCRSWTNSPRTLYTVLLLLGSLFSLISTWPGPTFPLDSSLHVTFSSRPCQTATSPPRMQLGGQSEFSLYPSLMLLKYSTCHNYQCYLYCLLTRP